MLKSGRIEKCKEIAKLPVLDKIATGDCNKKDELEDRDEFDICSTTRESRLKKRIRKRNGDVVNNLKDIKLVSIEPIWVSPVVFGLGTTASAPPVYDQSVDPPFLTGVCWDGYQLFE